MKADLEELKRLEQAKIDAWAEYLLHPIDAGLYFAKANDALEKHLDALFSAEPFLIAELSRLRKLEERVPEKCCLTCQDFRKHVINLPVTGCVSSDGLLGYCGHWEAM